MSKRKVVAGRYEDSDEETFDEVLNLASFPAKRGKSAAYALPRISIAPAGASSTFQIPRSASISSHGSVPGSGVSSARLTPTPEPTVINLGQEKNTTSGLTASSGTMAHSHITNANPVPIPHTVTHSRSTISMERQMNTLATAWEEYKCSNDEQHLRADAKLTCILNLVSQLAPGSLVPGSVLPGGTSDPSSSVTTPVPSLNSHLSNPSPTLELIEIVSKVAGDARNRVGKKKGGPEDNSLKEHARTTFYRMLGISAAKAIHPYFENQYGEPDTLPARFIDPETNYCQPYPHWKAPLSKQVAWVPTFLLRFRSTIPHDGSELSALLRNLSDEQIIILLNDGPFKSAQTAWRDMKKTDEELEAMRSNARRYHRAERKAIIRRQHIHAIPSLAGPDWEYLAHPGYVSQEESEDEGELVTKRPEYRSQWEINLYQAIRVAELSKTRAGSGLSLRFPLRRIEIVKRPIPQLERGTGNMKSVIRIPVCAISKSWRDTNPDDFQRYVPLLNTKVTAKPDISDFLAKHPMPTHEADQDDIGGSTGSYWGDAGGADNASDTNNVDGGSGVGSHGAQGEDVGMDRSVGEFYFDESSGVIGEHGTANGGAGSLATAGHNAVVVVGGGKAPGVEGPSVGLTDDIPIDPQLEPAKVYNPAPNMETSVQLQYPLAAASQMPPPPPLSVQYDSAPSNVGNGASVASSSAHVPVTQAPDASQPKRRGRPRGSKNKPKA
ncbi:hypothetical protein FRC08_006568 [Ceratobasidium sp. 394]|nr:hypothetical protein FRC08_006568 [Ceratobasidium sp. 394]